MTTGLIALALFLACVLLGGIALALVDRLAVEGYQCDSGFRRGKVPSDMTQEEFERWN